MIFGPLL